MKDWWLDRTSRERVILACGAFIVLITFLWLLLWAPVIEQQKAISVRIQTQRTTLAQLAEARALQTATGTLTQQQTSARAPGISLLSLVDQGMRMAGLAAAIRRIEPISNNTVNIVLEQAVYTRLLNWLEEIATQQNIAIVEFTMDRGNQAGTVNTRIQLRDEN